MKIKIFRADQVSQVQDEANSWFESTNNKIISVNMSVSSCNDFFMHTAPPMICNQWQEYCLVIIYEESLINALNNEK